MEEYSLDFKPILRYMDAIPTEHEGQPVFLLRDPIGIIEELVVIPQNIAFLLSLMDGKHDLRDLQAEATKAAGEIVPIEEIIKIVKFLDEKGLLWSKNFEEIKNKAYSKWFSYPFRPMAHANQAYPLSASEAKFFVEDILKLANPHSSEPPKILIVPHIDIKTGAKAYAESYSRFKIPEGSRIIILGVGHHLDLPFSILTKDIATPFGTVRNDKGGIFYLNKSKKLEIFPDHMAHKLEHSIEFQVLFLHHLLGDGFVVLPILIGPLPTFFPQKDLVEKFAEGIAELLDDSTYLLLAIDFCHLGLRYGDPFEVTDKHINRALEVDKTLIELTSKASTEEFLDKAKEVAPMKICGLSCLFLTNLILQKVDLKGDFKIYYQQAVPFGKGSAVSIVSAGYHI
ncbi:AmmeMemoRadiSam system protein B [Thermodesulfobacterium hydrogeniphilum]|uniref:AmmeMemoRadiSam system protein B n=1 Tax=Thermodesulfobacterium hydrogeniphilum TaxID=161156 RepID=UPI000571DE46|nr:AmmeMemoRadiSam system protein B [Thermodesulfobacterium hydrogeniphilum]